MKILQLCAVDFTLFHFLVPLVEAMQQRGHTVIAACSDGPLAARVREKGIQVQAVPFSRSLFSLVQHWRAYRELRALLQREQFEMVHVHTPVAALIGRLAARRAGVQKIVYTAHGFYFHDRMPGWKKRLFLALEWLGGRCTDILLTQAEEDAETARQHNLCRGGVVEAIGNGVDPDRFTPETDGAIRRRVRAMLGTRDDRCVIIMVGRLVAEKGYPELFRAVRDVDADLWVVGERLASDHAQDIGGEIAAVHNDPKLAGKVRFLGLRNDVPDLLKAADIFTLPSHREGMPRSIIEAMMSALPVVATNIRGSREEVLDGDTGLLVPVNAPAELSKALNRLVKDAGLRQAMGKGGRQRAEALYDESKVIQRQIQILHL